MISNQATIIMLTYNRLAFTKQTLTSLFETTTYPFSLIVVDNASSDGTIDFLETFLEETVQRGGFFKGYTLKKNTKNLGVSGGRNQGLSEAEGEWLVIIDNDLLFPYGWLTECIEVLKTNPSYGVCGVNYEGVTYPFVLENGKEFQHKQEGNVGGACMVFNTKLRDEIGYYTSEFGLYGEEDADFCLRARFKGYQMAYIKENGTHLGEDKSEISEYRLFKDIRNRRNAFRYRINGYLYKLRLKSLYIGSPLPRKSRQNLFTLRISKLLRATQTQNFFSLISVLFGIGTMRLIQEFRDLRYKEKEIKPILRERSSAMVTEPVTIIIPFRDTKELLEKCVESILAKTTYENYKILLINNQSKEAETLEYLEILSKNPKIEIVLYDEPFNYAAMHNWVMDFVKTEYVVLLNNDTEVSTPDWLTELMRWITNENVGVAGALLLFMNKTVQHAGVGIYPNRTYHRNQGELYIDTKEEFKNAKEVVAVTAACFITKKSLYTKVGGMDTVLKVNLNDVDYCLKVRKAGYQIIFEPNARLYHYESYTRKPVWTSYSKFKEYRKEYIFFWNTWGAYVKQYCLQK